MDADLRWAPGPGPGPGPLGQTPSKFKMTRYMDSFKIKAHNCQRKDF